MAYEFIAAGLRPAKPVDAMIDGIESRQRIKANQINLDAAQKQVQAEDAWGQLQRDEQGNPTAEAMRAYERQFPDQAMVRKSAMFKAQQDNISMLSTQMDLAAKLMTSGESPAELAKILKERNISIDPSLFPKVAPALSELGKTVNAIKQDRENAFKSGDTASVDLYDQQLTAIGSEFKSKIDMDNADLAYKRAATEAQRASAAASFAAAQKSRSTPDDPGPLQPYIGPDGKPILGTRAEARGRSPVPPATSLKDELDRDKVVEAKSRVSGNLDALEEYYVELSSMGAAVDTSRGGAENLSAAARASGPGQLAGKAFGTKEQSARNKINQMRPLLLQEIRQASAMGARGLDSNKELDFYLQAATDPSRDLQSNFAALNVLSQAYGIGKNYGDVNVEEINKLSVEYVGELPLVRTSEDYKALKFGTEYRDVTGKKGKKNKK